MNADEQSEAQELTRLSYQIEERLIQLGFVDDDAMGNIIHHLAELSLWGRKLALKAMPDFLNLPPDKKEELGELVVHMNYELTEMKEAIEDMEPAMIRLMNFLNPD